MISFSLSSSFRVLSTTHVLPVPERVYNNDPFTKFLSFYIYRSIIHTSKNKTPPPAINPLSLESEARRYIPTPEEQQQQQY